MKRSHSNGKRAQIEDSSSPILELIPNEVKNIDKEIVMSGNLIVYIRIQNKNWFGEEEIIEGYVHVKPNVDQNIISVDPNNQNFYILWTKQQGKENIQMRITENHKKDFIFEPEYHLLYKRDLTDYEDEKDPKRYVVFYIMKEKEYIKMCNYEIRNYIKLLSNDQSCTCLIYLNPEYTTKQTNEEMIKRLKKRNKYKYISWFAHELKIYKEFEKNPHPNICILNGLKIMNDEDGSTFPAMVLEQGVDFRNVVAKLERSYDKEDKIKEYYLKMEEFIDQMINGLRYLHELGYIHVNILIH